MIVIHQAIYGELQGKTSGHDLLAASDEKNELFRRVSGYTDLADRPVGGILSSPVVRGFFAEDHFLLIKTFPDKSPGLRSGRVFSHALFIPKADLHRVRELSDLFQYHLPDIQKEAKMHSLEYLSQEAMTITGAVNGREAAATNALLEKQPFVWLGEEGYWEWVARIWPKLPAKVKHMLKIGAAFGPSYVNKECLSLLYIPEDAKTLWERHSFRVLGVGESQPLRSSAANWLVGDVKKAIPFEILLNDFAPIIDSIETLNRLEDYGKAYHQIDKAPGLNHLLVLAHFVSQISPNERVGIKGKNKLMTAILQAIPTAPVKMFMALTYQSWKGFPDAITSVSGAVLEWLTNHLLQGRQVKECGAVLVKALEAETKNWWVNAVLEYVNNRLKRRQPSDASILWQWMKNEPALITQHTSWLPYDAENELTPKIPKLETAVAEAVLYMAEQKGWLVLHAKVAAQLYSAEKAIEAQLRIDTDEDHTVALEALSECISESSFVSVAASHTDARLHRIAGKFIYENKQLLKGIDIASEGWQKCWELAVQRGSDVWSGISNPQHTLFEILDHLLAGNPFSGTLLHAISIGKYSSLKDYPQRASIWHALPEKARTGFITATLFELFDDLSTSKLSFNDLEAELKNGVQSQNVQQHVVSSKTIPLTKKLRLFDVLPSLGECHAQQLIRDNRFSPAEAEEFGRLVSKNRWETVADDLYEHRSDRKDLVPALLQCSHLLGVWQRLKLSASGLKRDAISSEEWWNEFLEAACKLFPNGPEENGLWISAGGDLSQLCATGTGRYKWSLAVQILRNNGKPTTKKLLRKMRETYTGNETLKNLQETL
ncbi:effector-associated domain EAD1-containing protein (plasmid) [Methylomonas sp. HW2-6]|uniref:GAP1-N1 domain-containing protein n=1 Tax=Methylomonas sp. HW2-6 TaxID=3376687 RepID=UPI004042E41D